jgi:hypothetical protein
MSQNRDSHPSRLARARFGQRREPQTFMPHWSDAMTVTFEGGGQK